MPIDDDEAHNDKLFVGVRNHWVINKNYAVKEEAKLFLNWMVGSEKGKRYITERCSRPLFARTDQIQTFANLYMCV